MRAFCRPDGGARLGEFVVRTLPSLLDAWMAFVKLKLQEQIKVEGHAKGMLPGTVSVRRGNLQTDVVTFQ